jgi:aldose 1-epimerase
MKISRKTFGVLSNGKTAHLYTLKAGGLKLSVTDWGGHWVSLFAPDKNGKSEDVILGYSTLEGYTHNRVYIGATVGRYANRISGASFQLNGKTYPLCKNDGTATLHGGRRGFDQRLWKADAFEDKGGVFVLLSLNSPDGEEGYPGNMETTVCYGLTKSGELIASYQAKLDAPCPVNLTNHTYFNLAGEGNGTILGHSVKLNAKAYMEVGPDLLPNGKLPPVAGTPFDFTEKKTIGRDIEAAGGGYDHAFVVDREPSDEAGGIYPCGEFSEESSGRIMRIFGSQPSFQFYTGNFLKNIQGKAGGIYDKHSGFCLETQGLPDSPNRPEFPSCIYGPDRPYNEKAVFQFDVM